MRAQLNLASSPLQNNRRFFTAAAVVGIPALALFVMLCMKVVHDRAASGERREETARIEKEMAGFQAQRRDLEAAFADPATKSITQRATFLNKIIDQRSFPWTQFFLDLERRLPGGVRVLSINPELSGGLVQVKMQIGALSDKSKLDFLKSLEAAPEFSNLEVVSETRPAKGEDRDVVEVSLNAVYRAVSPLAAKAAEAGGGQ